MAVPPHGLLHEPYTDSATQPYHYSQWFMGPEDEAYAFAETGQATEGGDGDVLHSSGLVLAVIGKNNLLVI